MLRGLRSHSALLMPLSMAAPAEAPAAPQEPLAYLMLTSLAACAAAASLVLFLLERRRAARAGRRLELERLLLAEHYQELIRHANDLILLAGPSGNIVEANQRALSRYGYSREQMLALDLAALGAAVPGDAAWGLPFETEHRTSAGARFPVEVRVHAAGAGGQRLLQFIIQDLTERRKAEAALRESARQFQTLTDVAQSGIFQTDAAGRLLYANRLMQEFAGITPAGAYGQDWLRVADLTDRGALQEQWQRCLRTGEPFSAEFHLRAPDGRQTPVACHAAPLRSNAGAVEGFIGVLSDVSRIRQAEIAQQRSAEMIRMLVESAPAAIVAVDLDDRITLWNDSAQAMFGWSREEVTGQGRPGIPPDERAPMACLRARVLAGETVRGEEVTRLRRDGHRLTVSLSAAPLRDGSGAITGMMTVMVDITEKSASTRALRHTTELLRMSQKMARLGSWRVQFPTWPCESHEQVWEWSEETYHLFGVHPESFTPSWTSFLGMLHPDDAVAVQQRSRTALERDARFEADHRIIRADGSILHVHEHAVIERTAEGRPLRMTGTVQDITAYRRLEDQLIQAQRLDGVGRLAGGIAHDFNNLLTVILGFSDMLMDPRLEPAAARDHAVEIRRAASRGEYLVRQLLAFGRKQEITPLSTDLNRVVRESERMLMVLLGGNSRMLMHLSPELPKVWADPSQIEQVLMNLVVNASDAMPSGGQLTIQTSVVEVGAGEAPAAGHYAALTVTDTGTGIDAANMDQLFEPFFTTKPPGRGAGLGLASVYGIVRQNQGWVRVRSAPDCGASFQVLLPVSHVRPELEGAPIQPELAAGGPRSVLVVDDEDGIRKVVSLNLRRKGYQVLEAERAEEAIRIGDEFPGEIHLLLTDVVLPGMDGLELAELMRVARPRMKVLFCSGFPKASRFEQSREQHGFEYLQKPFSNRDLLSRVDALLGPVQP